MASPVIESTNTYQSVGDSATHTIPLPTGVAEGDRIIILACVDNNTAAFTIPSGYKWSQTLRASTQVALLVLQKVATASETNPDIVLDVSDSLSAISLRVSGSGDFLVGPALSANSFTQDPPLVDFANWSDTPDALSVACMFWDTGLSRTVSAFPTGYDSNQTTSNGEASTGTGLALASKNLTAVTSEDAPAFTLSAGAQGAAFSMIFREAYASGATNIVGTDEGYIYDIASGSTDRILEFYAVSGGSPVTGLSTGWTVTVSTNNGTGVAYSSPTITEVASGYYKLTIDEQTTVSSGQDFEHQKITIAHASHDTVTLRTKLVRPKITAGETLAVSSGAISGVSGSADVVVDTTIATVTDQQTLILTAGLADSGSLDGCLAIITDQSTANQKSIVFVQLHTVATGTSTITLVEAPTFTVAAGDSIKIFAKQPDPVALLAAAQSSIETYAPQTQIDWPSVNSDTIAAFASDPDFGTSGLLSEATAAATQTAASALRNALGLTSANLTSLLNTIINTQVVHTTTISNAVSVGGNPPVTVTLTAGVASGVKAGQVVVIAHELGGKSVWRATADSAGTTLVLQGASEGVSGVTIGDTVYVLAASNLTELISTGNTASDTAASRALTAVNQTAAAALRNSLGLASANLDTQLASLAAEAGSVRRGLVRLEATVSSVVIPGQSYGVTLNFGSTTIGTFASYAAYVTDSNGDYKAGPLTMGNSGSEGVMIINGTLAEGDKITVLRPVPTLSEIWAVDADGYTLPESLKLLLAAMCGKGPGSGAEAVFRAADDSKARITATVTAAGDRTAVTLDATG